VEVECDFFKHDSQLPAEMMSFQCVNNNKRQQTIGVILVYYLRV